MTTKIKCPKCKVNIAYNAEICPHCRTMFTAEEVAKRKKVHHVGVGCVIVGLIGLLGYFALSGGDPAKDAAAAKQSAEDKRKGMHCLSGWDGSSEKMVAAVKETLRDPKSFEHVETRITPVDKNGEHVIVMQYRAKNGFGGMNVENAMGVVKNADCSVRLTS